MAVHNSSTGGNDHVYLGSQVLLLLYAFMVPALKKKSRKCIFTNASLSVVACHSCHLTSGEMAFSCHAKQS